MNLRWLWLDHIPPELGLSPAERKRVQSIARQLRERRPRNPMLPLWVNQLPLVVPMLLLLIAAGLVALGALPPAAATFATALLLVLFITFVNWRKGAPYVRLALRTIGHEVCVDCGYMLRGLARDTTNCPECGSLRRLMVRSRGKRLGVRK